MEKRKSAILFSLTILSMYTLAQTDKLFAQSVAGGNTNTSTSTPTSTDSKSVSERSITPPAGTPGNPAITVYMRKTTVAKPTASQLVQIQAGTFTSPVCPANPDCGTANTIPPKVGTSSCPSVCIASSPLIGIPPGSRPFNYPSCPKGYEVISPGALDIYYEYTPPAIAYPCSYGEMDGYTAVGYTCGPDASLQGSYCSPNDDVFVGQYFGGGAGGGCGYYIATYRRCSTPNSCASQVLCSDPHWALIKYQQIKCTRPVGYVPATTQFDSSVVKRAPTSLICGVVSTQWTPG